MTRSIDLMFAIYEFRSFLNQIDGYQAAPFYHLLRIRGNPAIPNLDAKSRKRLSDAISNVADDTLRLEEGKLYFLTLLKGSGFIAQKLLAELDEDFVVTFVAGAITTEPDERQVNLLSGIEMLYDGINDYFECLVKALSEQRNEIIEDIESRRYSIISTNDFITLSITDPDRLYDLSLYDGFVEMQGGSKSWVTKHVLDGYQQYKRIKTTLTEIEQGEKRRIPCFGILEGYGLLLGLSCFIKFDLDRDQTIATLTLPFFLDLLYGHQKSLPAKDCFAKWLEQNGIQANEVKSISTYPHGLKVSYTRAVEISDNEALDNLLCFLSNRFGLFYDVAVIFMQLLVHNTNFNLSKYDFLHPWKKTFRLVVNKENLAILPIMDAINEEMEIFEDLDFRSPIVPWFSRMSALGPDTAWPKHYLKKVSNVSNEAKETIQGVFFEPISMSIEDYYGYRHEEKIYILRSQKEMLDKVEALSDQAMNSLKDVDFSDYLISMGYPDTQLPTEEYSGVRGLKRSVLHHSLVHLRLGVKNEFIWPMYIPPILE